MAKTPLRNTSADLSQSTLLQGDHGKRLNEWSATLLTYYDTEVYFGDDYDVYLERTAPERGGEEGREVTSRPDDSQPDRSREVEAELQQPVSDRISEETPKLKTKPEDSAALAADKLKALNENRGESESDQAAA